MGVAGAVTTMVVTEWYISFISENGEIFAEQYEKFHQEYSERYDITARTTRYRFSLVAKIKPEFNPYHEIME